MTSICRAGMDYEGMMRDKQKQKMENPLNVKNEVRFVASYCINDGHLGKQELAWEEYCVTFWEQKLQCLYSSTFSARLI